MKAFVTPLHISLFRKDILIFFIALAGTFNTSFAQNIDTLWQRTLGGSQADRCFSMVLTSDNGYILAGQTSSNNFDVSGNHGGADYWVVKLDSSGNILWQKTFGGTGSDVATSVCQTFDGGYIVAGKSNSTDGNVWGNHGAYDFWIVRLNVNGDTAWTKSLGGAGGDEANSIRQTFDGGYIVAGRSDSLSGNVTANFGGYDAWVIKLDSAANIIWEKSFGGSNEDIAYNIRQAADTGYVVAGRTNSTNGFVNGNNGGYDAWVVKLNAVGDTIWTNSLGGAQQESAESIIQTPDGGYVFSGYSTSSGSGDVSNNNGAADSWIVKINSLGNIEWEKSFGGTGNESTQSIVQTVDGGYIASGYTESNDVDVGDNNGGSDFWILKLDATGNLIWEKTYGGTGDEFSHSIVQNLRGDFVTAGYSGSVDGDVTGNRGLDDFWVLNLSGCFNLIYGQVNYNLLPLSDAEVILSRKRILPGRWDSIRTVLTDSNGEFRFSDLDSGTYVIEARPDTSLITSVLPTYFGDVPFWLTATRIDLNCGEKDTIAIDMLQLPARTGNGKISGYVLTGVNKRSQPIEGEDIIVTKVPPGSSAAHTTTDSDGYYEVDGLEPANYQVTVEIAGMLMINNVNLNITSTDTVFENVDFSVDENAGTVVPLNQTVEISELGSKELKTIIYPNPAIASVNLSFERLEQKPQSVELWNSKGQKIIVISKIESNQIEIRRNNLKAGVYLLGLIFADEVCTGKVIMQ